MKPLAEYSQIPLAPVTCCNHPSAIRRWTHQKATLRAGASPSVHIIDPGGLSSGQRAPTSQIFRAHRIWDVIEQDAKVGHTIVQQLGQTTLDGSHIGGIRIRHIQSRAAGIDEPQTTLPACGHRLPHFHQPGFVIRLPPDGSLVQIVLGTIKVSVQPAASHPVPKLVSLGWGPWRAIKPFDHAGQELGFGRVSHQVSGA